MSSNAEACELMPKRDTIKLRNRHIGKSCRLFYNTNPLKIIRGKGQYMFDEEDTRYLDCINNVAHVGHCHPKVVEAGSNQMRLLSTNNRFLHDEMVKCAQALTSKMPGDLTVCYFVNSGSEANDLAMRLAKTYTKQEDFIILDHAYHGHLISLMEMSPYKFNKPGGDPKPDYVHVASSPNTYRGKYNTYDNAGSDLTELYSKEVENIINDIRSKGKGIAGFMAEILQSCGGQIIPPAGYFKNIYKYVRDAGGVNIADEVQIGFGRMGTHYWAFESQDVIPDIVTIAKPMGNGHPIGAVITTPKIAESFAATGISYFNTYGGNPVSCAIANAVMKVIDTERLQENALIVGNYAMKKSVELKNEFDIVGDVRGMGLFLGIELIKGNERREPATEETEWIVDRMKNVHHILLSSDGPDENVIKFKPPMLFNMENVDELFDGLRECLYCLNCDEQISLIPQTNGICNLSTRKIIEKQDILIKSI